LIFFIAKLSLNYPLGLDQWLSDRQVTVIMECVLGAERALH
jgi:hypothetical protein